MDLLDLKLFTTFGISAFKKSLAVAYMSGLLYETIALDDELFLNMYNKLTKQQKENLYEHLHNMFLSMILGI